MANSKNADEIGDSPCTADLELKLLDFQRYYNGHRAHAGLDGRTPDSSPDRARARVSSYRWQVHCRGLYQTPIAA